jgi:hypothetical protein
MYLFTYFEFILDIISICGIFYFTLWTITELLTVK